MLRKGRNPTTRVDPIRDTRAIEAIKQLTKANPRDHLLFVMGINNGVRVSDLLSLKQKDVAGKKAGDLIPIKEKKTGKGNYLIINKPIQKALALYLDHFPSNPNGYLFCSRKRDSGPISIHHVNRMVKRWCLSVGLDGKYGCHTLRKTFGYIQRVIYGVGFEILCKRYNHSSPRVTMRYLGIEDAEVKEILMNEI